MRRRNHKVTIREALDPYYIKGHDVYKLDMPDRAYQLALLGLSDAQITMAFGVDQNIFAYWKKSKPEFSKMLDAGRMEADAAVAKALYQRATGFSHVKQYVSVVQKTGEVVVTDIIEYCPPDVTACVKWLNMRQRERWGSLNKVETDISIMVKKEELKNFSDEELEMMEKLGLQKMIENSGQN